MKLSIIIPVYNVEKYVERCILSCINQNITNLNDIELIIINDGSTDGSLEIIERIMVDYPNYPITLLSQCNSGLSVARNTGVYNAKGDYLWFVDSDDWITDGAIKNILLELLDEPDLLQIQYRYTYDDTSLNHDAQQYVFYGVAKGKDLLLKKIPPSPAQFTLYRREFFINNNLFFYPNIYHEDAEQKPRAYYLADKVKSCDIVCYNYYQRSSGISKMFKLKNAVDMITVATRLKDFTENVEKKYKIPFYISITRALNAILLRAKYLDIDEREIFNDKLYFNRELFNNYFKTYKLKYIFEGLALKISLKMSLHLYSLVLR